MKKMLRLLVLMVTPIIVVTKSQGQVGIGISIPDASAALDLTSTSRGLLTPRMSAAQRLAIPTPAEGLIVHQIDSPASGVGLGTLLGLYQFCGSQWILLQADNLGNHTASKNLNLTTHSLVGNGGSQGLQISNAGVLSAASLAGIGTRMVTTDASGNISSQALPSASSTTATDAYGDGSAGSYTVGAGADWTVDANVPNNGNLQFADFTVPAGVTLTVPSGTVFRCTGTINILGSVLVATGAQSTMLEVNPGISRKGTGITTSNTSNSGTLLPLSGGVGLNSKLAALSIPCNSLLGGGAGATTDTNVYGGAGGGNVTFFAKTGLNMGALGLVNANAGNIGGLGSNSQGGGGGGIVSMVTPGILMLAGTVQANGSAGAAGSYSTGGGGGGGGIVRLLAGTITGNSVSSTVQVLGGAGGSLYSSCVPGLGGGASGGDGGKGGGCYAPTYAYAAGSTGGAGIIISIVTANPHNLLK